MKLDPPSGDAGDGERKERIVPVLLRADAGVAVGFDLLRGRTDLASLVAGRPQPWGEGMAVYRIGDAVAGRNIHAAIYDALRLCKDL